MILRQSKQRTIKEPISVKGIGLQTGREVSLTLKPSAENTGVSFVRTDLPGRPAIDFRSFGRSIAGPVPAERRTALALGAAQVQTTEHLLAALSGLSIDNITIELDNEELPGLDGSARDFAALVEKAGVAEQSGPRNVLKVDAPVWCEGKDCLIAVLPDDKFRISYTLSYKSPAIGTQYYSVTPDEDIFRKEIAPARTFCLEEEAAELLRRGLGRGANYENTLVMGKSSPVKSVLRFPDEPVRHKILDLMGDLYILGMPVIGHVIALKSGHALNMELVKKLNPRRA